MAMASLGAGGNGIEYKSATGRDIRRTSIPRCFKLSAIRCITTIPPEERSKGGLYIRYDFIGILHFIIYFNFPYSLVSCGDYKLHGLTFFQGIKQSPVHKFLQGSLV